MDADLSYANLWGADFSGWKADHDKFRRGIEKMVSALRMSRSIKRPPLALKRSPARPTAFAVIYSCSTCSSDLLSNYTPQGGFERFPGMRDMLA